MSWKDRARPLQDTSAADLLGLDISRYIPVIGDRGRKARVRLPLHLVRNSLEVVCGIKKLQAASIGAFEDGIAKLPHLTRLVGLQRGDGGKIVNVDGAQQPAATAEAGQIGRGLEQAAQLAGTRGIVSAAVKGLDGAGPVHQGPIATTGDGNANVGQGRGIIRDSVDVGDSIEVSHTDMAEEISHRLGGVVPAHLQPGRLVGRQRGGAANGRAVRRTGDIGGRIAIGGIGQCAWHDVHRVVGRSGCGALNRCRSESTPSRAEK